jgi:hypothetical protein
VGERGGGMHVWLGRVQQGLRERRRGVGERGGQGWGKAWASSSRGTVEWEQRQVWR